jgi:outer membrane immunogenic protein
MKTKLIAVAVAALIAPAANAAEVQGPWIEARAGWDHVPGDEEFGSINGLLYGAAVGYDFKIGGSGFLGLQAGISGSTGEVCFEGVCAGAGRDIEILARAGVSVAERTSIHALAGYANSRAAASFAGFDIGANSGGLRLGAGVEQGFGKNLYSKLEYRFTTYADDEIEGIEVDGGNRHQVSVSFGVRF